MPELNLLPLWTTKKAVNEYASIVRVNSFPYVLGRGANCDHRIDDPIISRWHCIFSVRDGQLWIADLGSRNGTRINGQLLAEPQILADGDTLAIACYTYLLCLGELPLESRPVLSGPACEMLRVSRGEEMQWERMLQWAAASHPMKGLFS